MQKGKVAIYMCCYNHAEFVAEAIDSILDQTYTNWELWMADDGSSDDSAEIMATYESDKIHFYKFEENTRLVGVQSYLIEKIKDSDCEYIVGTASDDKWKPDRLEKQIEVMSKHEEYGACFSWDELLFSGESENDPYKDLNFQNYSHKRNRSRYEWLNRYTLYDNCMSACSAMLRKNVYFEMGGYNQYFLALGDFRLWLMTVMKYPIYMVEEPLVYYRRHGNNLSTPSMEGALSNLSETYVIKYELMENIKKHDFYRSFYKHLIYKENDSVISFEAAKLFFLFTVFPGVNVCDQVAITMFLENSGNTELMKELDEAYGLNNVFLSKFKGNKGLPCVFLNGMGTENLYPWTKKNIINVFLDLYGRKIINEDNFDNVSWNPFCVLCEVIDRGSDGEKYFNNMKNVFTQYRLRKSGLKSKKTMHVISDVSLNSLALMMAGELTKTCNVYFSSVRKKEEYFKDEYQEEDISIPGVEYVNLYDKANCALLFSNEVGIDPDIVYYIGCIGDGYECTDMVRGYGLGVSQIAMIKKGAFSDEKDMELMMRVLDKVDII